MPAGVLCRIPRSFSQNGTIKTNLRGIKAANPFDYAQPSRNITSANISTVKSNTIGGSGTWTNTVPYTYQAASHVSDGSITYPSIMSTSRTGTVLFRMYIKSDALDVSGAKTIILNGFADNMGGGSGFLIYLDRDVDRNVNNVFFVLPGTDTEGSFSINLNSSSLSLNTWYSYAIQFYYNAGDETFTLQNAYENGTLIHKNVVMNTMVTPSGDTTLFSNPSTGWPFSFGGITEFVFLESNSIEQSVLKQFSAGAPFI